MGSRQYLEDRRRKKQQQNKILIGLMVGGFVLVVGAFLLALFSTARVNLKERQIIIPEFTQAEQSGVSGLGDPDAPVIIEEFSDFGCNHCADFGLNTKKLLEEEYIQTGKVFLLFHSVGDLLGSPATLQASEAAYCAGDQEAFWPFHDLLFANQKKLFTNRGADVSRTMLTFAEILDLDLVQFTSCMEEREFLDQARSDRDLAESAGITGTPSFLINGVLYKGNQPYENFQAAINTLLAEAGE